MGIVVEGRFQVTGESYVRILNKKGSVSSKPFSSATYYGLMTVRVFVFHILTVVAVSGMVSNRAEGVMTVVIAGEGVIGNNTGIMRRRHDVDVTSCFPFIYFILRKSTLNYKK